MEKNETQLFDIIIILIKSSSINFGYRWFQAFQAFEKARSTQAIVELVKSFPDFPKKFYVMYTVYTSRVIDVRSRKCSNFPFSWFSRKMCSTVKIAFNLDIWEQWTRKKSSHSLSQVSIFCHSSENSLSSLHRHKVSVKRKKVNKLN